MDLRSPGRDRGGELTVGPIDPGQLVEIDLAGHRLPPDPRDRIIVKQKLAPNSNPSGELERRVVEDEQVYPGGGSSTSNTFGGRFPK